MTTPSVGLMFCAEDPPNGEHIAARWQEILDLAGLAERSGYSLIAVPEHHLLPSGHLAAPFVALGALAARTSTIRLATFATVATFWDPIRLAEEAAMVDILSQGRLTLGVALGNYDPELALFGVKRGEQTSRFEEVVSVLQMAMNGSRVDFSGRHFVYDGVSVTPRPVQMPVPIWVGAMSDKGVRRAARLRLPLILDMINRIDVLRPWAQLYRDLCSETGITPTIILPRYAWIGANEHDAERELWPHLKHSVWRYLKEITRFSDARFIDAGSPDDLDFQKVGEDRLLIGDSQTVRETLGAWCADLGADIAVVRFQGPTGPWGPQLNACVQDFGRAVVRSELRV